MVNHLIIKRLQSHESIIEIFSQLNIFHRASIKVKIDFLTSQNKKQENDSYDINNNYNNKKENYC